jgi:hypothetical protein
MASINYTYLCHSGEIIQMIGHKWLIFITVEELTKRVETIHVSIHAMFWFHPNIIVIISGVTLPPVGKEARARLS